MYKDPIVGIYKILNKFNGKFYIGSSVDIYGRWATHRSQLNKGEHVSTHLQNAWTKDGEDCFEFLILEQAEVSALLEREQHWLDTTQCTSDTVGYNLLKTAGSNLGFHHSDETKAKISEAMRTRIVSEETRKKFSDRMIGNKHSPESIEKQRIKMTGRKHSEEHKQKQSDGMKRAYEEGRMTAWSSGKEMTEEFKLKISEANKGRIFSEEHKQKLRKPKKKRSL